MLQGFVVIADAAQRGGHQIALRRARGVFAEHFVKLGNCLGKAVLLVQHRGEIAAGRGEIGRQFQRAPEQCLGILEPTDACGEFGHQPDRCDVKRLLLEPGTQQRFGLLQIVVHHGGSDRDHRRVVSGGFHRGDLRRAGRVILAQLAQHRAEPAMGFGGTRIAQAKRAQALRFGSQIDGRTLAGSWRKIACRGGSRSAANFRHG